jgi:hypothetical protein
MPYCPCCSRVDLLRLPDLWGFCVGRKNLSSHRFGAFAEPATPQYCACRVGNACIYSQQALVLWIRPVGGWWEPMAVEATTQDMAPGALGAGHVVVASSSDLLHAMNHPTNSLTRPFASSHKLRQAPTSTR